MMRTASTPKSIILINNNSKQYKNAKKKEKMKTEHRRIKELREIRAPKLSVVR